MSVFFSGDYERGYGESGDEAGSVSSVGGGNRARPSARGTDNRGAPHPPDLLAFPQNGGHVSPAGSVASSSLRSPLRSPPGVYPPLSGTLPYNRSQSPFNGGRGAAHPATGYVTIPRRPRAPSWAAAGGGGGGGASTPFAALNDPLLGVDRLCEPVYDNLGPRTTADGSSVLSLNKAVADSPGVRRPAPQYSQTLPHKSKLSQQQPQQQYRATGRSRPQQFVDAAADPGRTPPPPAPRSPPERMAAHNALPPNYSPLLAEMADARNRSSWAPGRAGTPETGVLKPAGQTSRKVPPKPPPKPGNNANGGGPLFEDEGEDGTEV